MTSEELHRTNVARRVDEMVQSNREHEAGRRRQAVHERLFLFDGHRDSIRCVGRHVPLTDPTTREEV